MWTALTKCEDLQYRGENFLFVTKDINSVFYTIRSILSSVFILGFKTHIGLCILMGYECMPVAYVLPCKIAMCNIPNVPWLFAQPGSTFASPKLYKVFMNPNMTRSQKQWFLMILEIFSINWKMTWTYPVTLHRIKLIWKTHQHPCSHNLA